MTREELSHHMGMYADARNAGDLERMRTELDVVAAASEEAARNELDWLEKLEAMTHNGRGTILWEVDAISDEILARIAALTQRGEGGGK